jgi:hypothetical protein
MLTAVVITEAVWEDHQEDNRSHPDARRFRNAISAAYTSAYAGNMKGTPVCSDGMNCFSHKSKVATARAKGHVKPPKMGN